MENVEKCPLKPVEQRFLDCLELFVEAKANYFKPRQFRLALNNYIQTFRTITFVLQKNKKIFDDFEQWYEVWQAKMREDEIMRWLVESRNTIVKKGDLKTYSKVRVEVMESWLGNPVFEQEFAPFLDTKVFAKLIARTMPEHLVVKLLRVERLWVDEMLPKVEILEGLAHGIRVIQNLLEDAHLNIRGGNKNCELFEMFFSKNKLIPCMKAQRMDRTIWVDINTGETLDFSFINKKIPKDIEKKLEGHYPKNEKQKRINDFEDEVNSLYEQAKIVLKTDGYHGPIALIGYPGGRKRIQQLNIQNRTEKHLVFHKIASYIVKTGAISIILINEVWASDIRTCKLTQEGLEGDNVREALLVIGVNSDEKEYSREVFFRRNKKKIVFEEEIKEELNNANMLTPFRKAFLESRK